MWEDAEHSPYILTYKIETQSVSMFLLIVPRHQREHLLEVSQDPLSCPSGKDRFKTKMIMEHW
jgi:hypothetical protein